jgi:hypothetical protein
MANRNLKREEARRKRMQIAGDMTETTEQYDDAMQVDHDMEQESVFDEDRSRELRAASSQVEEDEHCLEEEENGDEDEDEEESELDEDETDHEGAPEAEEYN